MRKENNRLTVFDEFVFNHTDEELQLRWDQLIGWLGGVEPTPRLEHLRRRVEEYNSLADLSVEPQAHIVLFEDENGNLTHWCIDRPHRRDSPKYGRYEGL